MTAFQAKAALGALGAAMLLMAYGIVNGNLEGYVMSMERHGVLAAATTLGFSRLLLLVHLIAGALMPWLYEFLLEKTDRPMATFVTIVLVLAPLPPVCLTLALRYPVAEELALAWLFTGALAVILTGLTVSSLAPEPVMEESLS